MVTIFPDTLAMLVLELAYENAPGLFEDGCVSVNVPPFEYVRASILKLVMDGVVLLIVNDAVIVPDV
jgi:peroxiredoxin